MHNRADKMKIPMEIPEATEIATKEVIELEVEAEMVSRSSVAYEGCGLVRRCVCGRFCCMLMSCEQSVKSSFRLCRDTLEAPNSICETSFNIDFCGLGVSACLCVVNVSSDTTALLSLWPCFSHLF